MHEGVVRTLYTYTYTYTYYIHVHVHLRLPGCGHVSSTTEPFLDLSLAIPGWSHAGQPVSAPASVPAARRATATAARPRSTEAHARRYNEVLGVSAGPASVPAVRRATATATRPQCTEAQAKAQGRRYNEVLASLPVGLTAPPAHLGLASCLQAFAAPELLRGENAFECNVCARAAAAAAPVAAHGLYTAQDARFSTTQYSTQDARRAVPAKQPALKWSAVSKTPLALTLHLKRWGGRAAADAAGGAASGAASGKIATAVPFPMTLDLTPFAAGAPIKHVSEIGEITKAAEAAGGGAPPSTAEPLEPLQLYAVVEHLGSLASSGHYLCYVRLGEEWFKMSDVRDAKVVVVAGAPSRGSSSSSSSRGSSSSAA